MRFNFVSLFIKSGLRNLKKREASKEEGEEVPKLNTDGPAVLYLPLGGGGGGGCPSLAESAVVGVSQMVFLWTGLQYSP